MDENMIRETMKSILKAQQNEEKNLEIETKDAKRVFSSKQNTMHFEPI